MKNRDQNHTVKQFELTGSMVGLWLLAALGFPFASPGSSGEMAPVQERELIASSVCASRALSGGVRAKFLASADASKEAGSMAKLSACADQANEPAVVDSPQSPAPQAISHALGAPGALGRKVSVWGQALPGKDLSQGVRSEVYQN